MTRLTIKQTENLIVYFQSKLNRFDLYLDATDTREDIENIINEEDKPESLRNWVNA